MKDTLRSTWRKSSYSDSAGGECVELADLATTVGVRDSKNPHGPALHLTRTAATTLAAGIKSGTLDL
ncbi:DUF397 domain-containing protein [Actinomadura atramentaria]|uniref:DUF397 domain-containing protein n=1 Tax=Actinomadura atramentaria TaxID=1990 RepID=UPI00036381C1|nr:DUF397 domain-containing protein [Actinomadura atramentaria]